ncbi:BT_3987 domain-containing protein [Ornithobacterium rhinotracheale]|uniref:BT-3987-like N-terminal domain-containing protein n=1 Tax=Ornithobacterium rhinotracheale (strain ATCC 51463 / DSM 15997 / CCUG 23171 / CIP 104009 / LMG 9086) TaxID=867902 RepID=I4A225_ORNRL|nr:DUF1735 domain-containing protein [Ornithobacterium rhinotracheale]AFL98009.1 hypothetical protein Ornrh_1864 [Ornithobacterium rhinotracheale DSM 15997]AIQ00653.1 hypothetical protein Q785_09165 [Ornithobacterium rhinotracheale ORT-UMN 88]KGB66267.1 hypothetical protein Q787_08980 [Ornithobacterium rhinotracheale H06-030791]MBN3661660.1 DUF1735 domain-containing protein [Ornithobacterium rhinotracheale]MCK0193698.1 DUF1735 and LamG domain-containing protein [Ornithobacterium rhinotracheale
MKKIKHILLATGASWALFGCSYEDSVPKVQDPNTSVGYIEQLLNGGKLRFTVDDEGGKTLITPRISDISNGSASFDIEVAPELLEAYNREKNANYQVLPNNVFNLINTGNKNQKGKKLHIDLAEGEYGANIEVTVGRMIDESGNKLPVSTSYAIPVRMSNIKGKNIVNTGKNTEAIIFLNRRFTTSVMRMVGRITLQSKDDKVRLFDEWTAQYTFMPERVNNNFGLMYPNNQENEKRGHSTYYATLYGGQVTQFTPSGGKLKFNQPGFEDFTFEAGKWYNISLVYQGGNLSFYVNGELAYKSAWGAVPDWTGMHLGNGSFNGYAREIRFWSKPLTPEEINSTMYFADPAADGLEVYLPLNKEVGYSNVAKGKEDSYVISFDSGASASSINFETEVTIP